MQVYNCGGQHYLLTNSSSTCEYIFLISVYMQLLSFLLNAVLLTTLRLQSQWWILKFLSKPWAPMFRQSTTPMMPWPEVTNKRARLHILKYTTQSGLQAKWFLGHTLQQTFDERRVIRHGDRVTEINTTEEGSLRISNEAAAMRFLEENTMIPIPTVYETTSNSITMEFIEGSTLEES